MPNNSQETTKAKEENSQILQNTQNLQNSTNEIGAENNKSQNKSQITNQNKSAKFGQILNGKIFKMVGISLVSLLLFTFLTMFWLTPSNFRSPKMDHSHFRLQYIFQGQMEDFGSPRYQVDYVKDVCNQALTESPIHFHDNKGQIVHIHWQKVTGGQVLKFYGLNKIGGIDNLMGWKLDDLAKFKITPIPIHSDSLPEPRPQDKFWVYVGEKDKFEKRSFEDFVKMDLETFFGQNSIIKQNQEEEEKIRKQSGQNEQKFEINKNVKQNYTQNLEEDLQRKWEKVYDLAKLANEINKFGSLKAEAHGGIDHANETEEQANLAETKRLENEQKALENRNNNINSNNSISNSVSNSLIPNSSQNSTNANQISSSNSQSSSLTNPSFTDNSQSSIQNNSSSNNSNNSKSSQNSQSNSSNPSLKTEAELKKINNLLGNVVIFVQETEPTSDQIKLRFDNLEPLGDSVCGG